METFGVVQWCLTEMKTETLREYSPFTDLRKESHALECFRATCIINEDRRIMLVDSRNPQQREALAKQLLTPSIERGPYHHSISKVGQVNWLTAVPVDDKIGDIRDVISAASGLLGLCTMGNFTKEDKLHLTKLAANGYMADLKSKSRTATQELHQGSKGILPYLLSRSRGIAAAGAVTEVYAKTMEEDIFQSPEKRHGYRDLWHALLARIECRKVLMDSLGDTAFGNNTVAETHMQMIHRTFALHSLNIYSSIDYLLLLKDFTAETASYFDTVAMPYQFLQRLHRTLFLKFLKVSARTKSQLLLEEYFLQLVKTIVTVCGFPVYRSCQIVQLHKFSEFKSHANKQMPNYRLDANVAKANLKSKRTKRDRKGSHLWTKDGIDDLTMKHQLDMQGPVNRLTAVLVGDKIGDIRDLNFAPSDIESKSGVACDELTEEYGDEGTEGDSDDGDHDVVKDDDENVYHDHTEGDSDDNNICEEEMEGENDDDNNDTCNSDMVQLTANNAKKELDANKPYRLVLKRKNKFTTALDPAYLQIGNEEKCEKRGKLYKVICDENISDRAGIEDVSCSAIVSRVMRIDQEFSQEEFVRMRDATWLPPDQLPRPSIDITVAMLHSARQMPKFLDILQQIASGEQVRATVTMQYELLRLCTMRNFPKEDKPYLTKLAANGFYYAGQNDELICYCCGVRRRNWTSVDNPKMIHLRLTPMCKFLKDNENVNFPVPESALTRPERFQVIDEIPDVSDSVMANRQHPEDVSNDHSTVRAGVVTTQMHNHGSNQSYVRADNERRVVESSPIEGSTSPSDGTAAGRSEQPTGTSDNERRVVESSSSEGSTSPSDGTAAGRSEQPTGTSAAVAAQIPKHPQYATRATRLATFTGWPDNTGQSADLMSEAGFYFAGLGDCVRCFFCGIGLRHWTEEDNPFVEHARWGKNCVYLRQKKGEEFIKLVQMAIQMTSNTTPSDNDTSGNQVTQEEIERLLLTDAAQSVLEMGYQPRIIKQAIESIISPKPPGGRRFTAQELMEKVLDLEESAVNNTGSDPAAGQDVTRTAVGDTGNTAAPVAGSNTKPASKSAGKKNKAAGKKDKKKTSDTDEQPLSARELRQENERLREQTQCRICLDKPISIVFLPCGHLVTCGDCAPAMRNCPMCRSVIKGTVRTYMQ